MNNLINRFRKFVEDKNLFHSRDKLLLAVSGGLDSVVLVELCFQSGFDFVIAHANFNLRGEESMRDQLFVESLSRKYKVPAFSKSFLTEEFAHEHRCSIQVAARELRYTWFREFLNKSNTTITSIPNREPLVDYILTAHHQDDNVETLLINFFKGTGIAGLHGILPKQGHLVRPLLFATKDELREFAVKQMLDWVEDSSNESDKYTRNQIRHKLLPAIYELFPTASGNLAENISRFGEIEILYRQAIDLWKKKLLQNRGSEIHIPALQLKKSTPLRSLVFEMFKDYGFSPGQTDEIIRLLDAESGKFVLSPTHRLLKNRQWLIISGLETRTQEHVLVNKESKEVEFGSFHLDFSIANGKEYQIIGKPVLAELDADRIQFPLLLRRWKKGDYFYPLGMKKKKKLSRFFIDQKLSQNEKSNVWILEMQKKIVWIVGLRIDNRFAIRPGSTSRVLKVEMRML
jgi:tRNA(Ile)-lysidine synthase